MQASKEAFLPTEESNSRSVQLEGSTTQQDGCPRRSFWQLPYPLSLTKSEHTQFSDLLVDSSMWSNDISRFNKVVTFIKAFRSNAYKKDL